MIHLTIQGRPLGKQRHRTSIRGKGDKTFTHEWTPEQTVNYETLVRLAFMDKYPKHVPWERNVALVSHIDAFYPIPMSYNARQRENALTGVLLPLTKPDGDNILKVIWDSLNQVAYADDSQIVKWPGGKYFSDRPRVEITLYTLAEYRELADL